jgi:hypothetical protein
MSHRVVAMGSALLLAAGLAVTANASPDRPDVSMAVRHDTSPALRDQRIIPHRAAKPDRQIPNKVPLDMAQRAKPHTDGPDPVVDQGPIVNNTPTPLLSFDGQNDDDNAALLGGRIVPPDTNGDVGLTHYVQTINLIMAVYLKSNGVRIFGPVGVDSLWAGFGGICETNNDGDPTVLYDDAANRWVVSQFAIGADGHQCVAVSTTGDPTGSYYRYDFVISPGKFNDYPKMGIWSDGYYVTANQFAGSFEGVIAVAFERDRMLSGLSAQMVKFGPLPCGATCPFAVQPVHWDGGSAPPAGAPAPFIMSWDDETWGTGTGSDGYRLWEFDVSWAAPAASTFLPLAPVNSPEFDGNFCNFNRACIPQPRPGEKLDASGQFTMYRGMYRNFGTHESIVISHSTDLASNNAKSRGGIRWAEVRDNGSGWVLHQSGTFSPDTSLSRWMPSIAQDKQGNIAIGYSVASGTVFPGIRYATRSAGDPLGTMGGEQILVNGGGAQQSSSSRWGDYSSMSVDPVDGCTFWYTQEYYSNSGSFDFKTRIGAFKQPGCV